jgi:steroid delta-isomerase-like uncharacterized protein
MSAHAIEAHSPQALVQRFFNDVFNRQDLQGANEVLAPGFVAHHPAFPDGIRGVEGIMQMMGMFRAGLPDLKYTLEDTVQNDSKIAARWSAIGTHRGSFMGVAATDRTIRVIGIDIFRAEGGKLVEAWVCSDFFGMFQQMGAFPPVAPPRR